MADEVARQIAHLVESGEPEAAIKVLARHAAGRARDELNEALRSRWAHVEKALKTALTELEARLYAGIEPTEAKQD